MNGLWFAYRKPFTVVNQRSMLSDWPELWVFWNIRKSFIRSRENVHSKILLQIFQVYIKINKLNSVYFLQNGPHILYIWRNQGVTKPDVSRVSVCGMLQMILADDLTNSEKNRRFSKKEQYSPDDARQSYRKVPRILLSSTLKWVVE